MQYECGCFYGPDDEWDACCPVHSMPMKLGTIDYRDLEWAQRELARSGMFSVDDLDNEG